MMDHSFPLVTIAIPTYNRARAFLPQALQSAVKQTYENIEIVVSDNCSDDETELVVKSFRDDRIRYYKQKENIGFLKNVNFCLEKASGEYFVFLFDDDLIDLDFVECCMNAAKGHRNVGIILTGARLLDEKGGIKSELNNQGSGRTVEDFCLGWFDSKFPLYLCSTLFLTKGLREIGGIRSKTHTYCDVVAEVQIVSKYNRVDVFDVKASFREHANNQGSTVLKVYDWCEDSVYLLEMMCALSSQKRAVVKSRGMKYFCKINFIHACNISSPFQRISAYVKIYRKFHYSYSLFLFLYNKNVGSAKRFIRRIFPKRKIAF